MHHIRSTLPDIKARIGSQLAKYSGELKALGGAMGETNPVRRPSRGGLVETQSSLAHQMKYPSWKCWHSQGSVVLSTITEFCSEFRTMIDGNTNDLSLNELSGGARISFVFHELFNNGVRGIDPFDQNKDGDIRTILYNSAVSLSARKGLGRGYLRPIMWIAKFRVRPPPSLSVLPRSRLSSSSKSEDWRNPPCDVVSSYTTS
jgi:hypothetical protein